jgi:RNA polymerase sigma-70 factor (ECF subfamily)
MHAVYAFAYRMTGNHADADELAQQTFVNAYRNFNRFKPGTKFRSWALTIAANLCTDLYRRKTVRREVPLTDCRWTGDREGDPVEKALRDETSRHVWRALETLPPDQRAVLILHAMEDVPLAELARNMNEPEGTVRWKYFEARKKMRAAIARSPLAGRERLPERSLS